MKKRMKFRKITEDDLPIIFKWLEEPHMIEFWDNSSEHRGDIEKFVKGGERTYFGGITTYWVADVDDVPYAFLLTTYVTKDENVPELYLHYLSKTGSTITIDFGIGNTDFLGKGLAANTLINFAEFFKREVDSTADTFFIDPDENNPRAYNVYQKAGFAKVGQYRATEGAFIGHNSDLMVKRI